MNRAGCPITCFNTSQSALHATETMSMTVCITKTMSSSAMSSYRSTMSASPPLRHTTNVIQASRHEVQSCHSGAKKDSDLLVWVAPQTFRQVDHTPMQLGRTL